MFFSYPLPVTKNYAKIKKDKTETKSKETRPKFSIWSQTKIKSLLPHYYENIEAKDKDINSIYTQKVFLFHSEDTKQRESELDSFYRVYLPEIHLDKKSNLLLNDQILKHYSLSEFMRLYRGFDISLSCKLLKNKIPTQDNIGSEKQEILKNKRIKKEEHDESYLLPKFLPEISFLNITNRLPTLYECKHVCESSHLKTVDDNADYISKWLRLMSWWKLVSDQLQVLGHSVYLQLKSIKSHNITHETLFETVESLDDLMTYLDLSHSSAELSTLQQYISIKKFVPDNSEWCFTYKAALITNNSLIYNTLEDSRLVAFMMASSYHCIQVLFDVIQALENELDEKAMIEVIETTTVEFYNDVVRSLQIDATYSGFVLCTVELMTESFRELIEKITKTRNQKELIDNPFNYTICVVVEKLYKMAHIITENHNIKVFFGEANIAQTMQYILKFIFCVTQNGTFLAYKVFQEDFITSDFLLKISQNKSDVPSSCLFYISCAQIAYSLIVAYQSMHREHTVPEGCYDLPLNYEWSDFRTFLYGNQTFSKLPVSGFTNYQSHLKLCAIQNRFCSELESELINISSLAKYLNELLNTVKYI